MEESTFLLGVNYWPARKGVEWWRQFDRAEVEADFAAIADAGIQAVRIFLVWEDFQPRRDGVEARSVARLEQVLDVAASAGLRVVPSLFTGTVAANVVFWPPWAIGGRDIPAGLRIFAGRRPQKHYIRDIWRDTSLTAAQNRFVEGVVAPLAEHPAIHAWDLGHHTSDGWRPLGRSQEGRDWASALARSVRRFVPQKPLWMGASLRELREESSLRVNDMARIFGQAAISLLDPDGRALDLAFAEFVVRLVAALTGQVPLVHAVGVSTKVDDSPGLDEEEQAAWAEQVVLVVRRLGVSELYWWAWSDYDRRLWRRPPLDVAPAERAMGLVRADGTPKPALAALQRAARQPVDVVPPQERLDPNRYYSEMPFEALYRRFRETGRLSEETEGGEQE